MELQNYKLSKGITAEKLKENGFINLGKSFLYKRNLYKKQIILYIAVNKESMEITRIDVLDEKLGQIYIPFYNPSSSTINEVSTIVTEKLEKIILDLVKKGVLKNED